MAKAANTRRNGHSRQRPASTKAKATSKAKPRRGGSVRSENGSSGNGKNTTARGKKSATARNGKSTSARNPKKASRSTKSASARSPKSATARNGKSTTSPSTKAQRASTERTAKPQRSGTTRNAGDGKKSRRTIGKAGTRARKAPKAKPLRKAATALAEHSPSLQTPKPSKPVRKLAAFAIRKAAKKTFGSAADRIRDLADNAGAKTVEAIRDAADRAADVTADAEQLRKTRRLPIQKSIDIAVPIQVAWEEWMSLESLPEGVHVITDIERDGDQLFGRIKGPHAQDWEAEVLDVREQQSFAWQSHEGTDCAGLATFHSLSKRLTRIELNLDVVPKTPVEAVQLATRIADHRAETELRRLKARLELINPDLYEDAEEEDAPHEERAGGDAHMEGDEDGQPGEVERADEGSTARSAKPEDDDDEEPVNDEELDEEPLDEEDLEDPEPDPDDEYAEAAA
jgi:uncharacterized membrane protein